MALGLNLGLEDAAVLGSLLSHVRVKDQIPQATAMYERLRLNRTARMLEETQAHGARFHLSDDKLREQRDRDLARSFDNDSDWTHPQQQKWIWSYDAYEDAEKAYLNEPF
ncbi:hypothetical protein VPNG_01588 [Cytospora leucostoma]|uniref:FAD-binding domain-containing protein n=1 Tax=Cytospora leucostoma TaxID=1230097 RepID=A0A423XJK0_9PEZI|nr:hypothetical protein VPNG_01588 [Cytospora leucostoma]